MKTFYGYEYDKDGMHSGAVVLNGTTELAQFICKNQKDKVVTDTMDDLVLNTFGSFINRCPDQGFLQELLKVLIPMQQGGKRMKMDMDVEIAEEV